MTTLTMSEDDLLTAVIDLCRTLHVLVHHSRPARVGKGWATPIQGDAGLPDLIIAGSKGVLFRELKSDGGRLTREQAKWLVTLGITGNAATWRPGDLPSGRIADEIRAVR